MAVRLQRLLSFYSKTMSLDTLLAVTLVYRHGDRLPLQFYPNDPHKDSPIWESNVPGDLTNEGKTQMYELGKWLRNRYDGFLSKTYKQNEIYVLSSNKDRCIRSALSNLAGLYPPTDRDLWNEQLLWQPIPVHSIPGKYDNIVYVWDSSPKYVKAFLQSIKNIEENHKELYENLSKHAGAKIRSFLEAVYLWDALDVEKLKNLKLPKWSEDYFEKLQFLRDEYFLKQTSTLEMTQLVCGRFFHELLQQFDAYSSGNDGKIAKMRMISGHDINISIFLSALNIPHLLNIPLAACLMFELRKKQDGELYVQLVYKTEKTEIIQIGEKGSKWDYENFVEVLSKIALSEEEYHKINNS